MENYTGNLFQAVAACSLTFLQNKSTLYQQLQKTLPIIGTTANVDRAYVFRNYLLDSGDKKSLVMSYFAEWCNEGVKPEIGNPSLTGLNYYPDCVEMLEEFKKGYPWVISREDLSTTTKETYLLLTQQGIHSVIFAPIIVESSLWGFAGFDYCDKDKSIRPLDISALILYAALVAASLSRYSQEMDLVRCMEFIAKSYNKLLGSYIKPTSIKSNLPESSEALIRSQLDMDTRNYISALEKHKQKIHDDLVSIAK